MSTSNQLFRQVESKTISVVAVATLTSIVFLQLLTTYTPASMNGPTWAGTHGMRVLVVGFLLTGWSLLGVGIALLQRRENGWPHVVCYPFGGIAAAVIVGAFTGGFATGAWKTSMIFHLIGLVVCTVMLLVVAAPAYYLTVREFA